MTQLGTHDARIKSGGSPSHQSTRTLCKRRRLQSAVTSHARCCRENIIFIALSRRSRWRSSSANPWESSIIPTGAPSTPRSPSDCVAGRWRCAVNGFGERLLLQCGGRESLCQPEMRTARSVLVSLAGGGRNGGVRMRVRQKGVPRFTSRDEFEPTNGRTRRGRTATPPRSSLPG